jgi:hypothetical protein
MPRHPPGGVAASSVVTTPDSVRSKRLGADLACSDDQGNNVILRGSPR